ncbi:hypothetical protein Hden_1595 [Hyphomicrobium denitrificans ATCC 51888]|uniref:Uncharacterized protein n=1 Tax=Hyphomicrobium denitrificans (strain ATCC 51888 / DSM 1869 / NCIMB 11706 / TK 0415) TaxID=582899 RepID=D8JQ81_HYPDA|nr:hypothetical protein [Hyphomicrobium denitrificans]ADJ22002.1 hypothetical protein Hden_0176 [Hyphomicrobium denitrificans ATCC 51888]ADJ23402.1 hypothetical protein Hden_1595 [Hyphomicrobium denitrificans ATCC 51888]
MVVIENILEFFFDKVGGKLILGGALIASLITWFAYEQRSIGAAKTVAKIEQRTQANVEKAQAARRSVETLPADRLTDRYRRD